MGDKRKMKSRGKKKRPVFQEQWMEKWHFVENKGSIVCVICKCSVSIPKSTFEMTF
jgi:hypothetical protein